MNDPHAVLGACCLSHALEAESLGIELSEGIWVAESALSSKVVVAVRFQKYIKSAIWSIMDMIRQCPPLSSSVCSDWC